MGQNYLFEKHFFAQCVPQVGQSDAGCCKRETFTHESTVEMERIEA